MPCGVCGFHLLHFAPPREKSLKKALPCRLNDMIHCFGRAVPEMSMIINAVIDFLYEHHGHIITEWNHQIFSPRNLEINAEAVHGKGAALENCFGFVDGTICPICRPR